MKSFRDNSKKGVTPVIATIILIAGTLVLALVVGAYTFGLFGSNVKTVTRFTDRTVTNSFCSGSDKHSPMAKLEALYTAEPINCKNGFHDPPALLNGYYEFVVGEKQERFWKFLSPTEKSRMMNEYHVSGKCLLCSIDEALQQ